MHLDAWCVCVCVCVCERDRGLNRCVEYLVTVAILGVKSKKA